MDALRSVSESLVCLVLAVTLFRTFLVEGYIISTGSMAPHLLGYHKRVTCPACRHEFEYGVEFDSNQPPRSQIVSCPNCDQPGISVAEVPRNDGDQLLVFKSAYQFRDPFRWEVVVFLNPSNPSQAYVKRVAGLPNESVQISDGDLFINGQREQKPIEIQRAMRLLVFDQTHPVKSKAFISRWVPGKGWASRGQGFELVGADRSAPKKRAAQSSNSNDEENSNEDSTSQPFVSVANQRQVDWLYYMHWPRLPSRDRQDVMAGAKSFQPRPITDLYGYNPTSAQRIQTPVDDLMLDAKIELPLDGQFYGVIRSRDELLICEIDRLEKLVRVWTCTDSLRDFRYVLDNKPEPLSIGKLSHLNFDKPIHVELSAFDRRAIVCIDGKTLIDHSIDTAPGILRNDASTLNVDDHAVVTAMRPTVGGHMNGGGHVQPVNHTTRAENKRPVPPLDHGPERPTDADPRPRSSVSPVRIGAAGTGVRIHSIRIFRDVHYTSRDSQHGVLKPVQLGADEFFFLGDNSPVSLDSRGWRDPVVARSLIVGRPMVVHLPSRPSRLRIGSWVRHIRIPDFSRIRKIR